MDPVIEIKNVTFSYPEASAPALDGVSLAEPEVYQWILASLKEEIEPILGGIMK